MSKGKNNALNDESLSKASGGEFEIGYHRGKDGRAQISIDMDDPAKDSPDVTEDGAFQGLFMKKVHLDAPYSSANPGGITDPNYIPPAHIR
jgi:hypothetical protein